MNLIALILAISASQGPGADGGNAWLVTCDNCSSAAAPVSVDGGTIAVSNFPATQPVSIASMPTTPVTGTFWQATQPVSIASMPSTPVTGTFWQATQPVSGTLSCNAGSGTFTVSGTVTANAGTGTLATSLASVPTHGVTLAASSISGSNPCLNPTATVTGISGATSGTASVQLVALSGSTKIYICSMNVTGISGTTPTFKLQYGTGTACGTGTTGIVGPWTTAANTVYNFVGPTFAVTPAGQALCYVQTGTSPVSQYNLVYVQQ